MRMGEVPLGYTEEEWQRYPDQVQPPDSNGSLALFDSDGPGFGDLLDVINPLQHIPVVSSIYREVTGDDIGAAARIIGDTLYGGPIGLVASIVNIALQETSGEDIGGNVIAALFGDETTIANDDGPVALAAATASQAAANTAIAVEVPWIDPDSLPVDAPGDPAAKDAALAEARAMSALISPAAGVMTPGRAAAGIHPPAAGPASARPAADSRQIDGTRHPEAPGRPPAAGRPPALERPAPQAAPAPAENPSSDPMAANIAASMLGALEQYERLVRDRQGAGQTVDIDG